MNIIWIQDAANPNRRNARVGLIRAFIEKDCEGNVSYCVYILRRSRRKNIVHADVNIGGGKQVNARARCEFLMKSFDKHHAVDLLPNEVAKADLDNVPPPKCKPMVVEGIYVNHIYRHIKSGEYYTVVAVANSHAPDNDKWPTQVVYRSLSTATVYARAIELFDPQNYELVSRETPLVAKTDFLFNAAHQD